MKKILDKLKRFVKKGSSEALTFAYLAPLLCFLVIETGSYVQLNYDMHELTNALDVAGRAASVSTSIEDAETLSQMIAESSIYSNNISNVQVGIDYATADDEWQSGLLLKVTITADIDTLSLIQSTLSSIKATRQVSKTMIYSVETMDYSTEDLYLLANVMYHEAGSSGQSGMIAIGTCVMNRVDNPRYTQNTVYDLVYAPGQMYDCYDAGTQAEFNSWLANPTLIPMSAISCARMVLSGQKDSRLAHRPPGASNYSTYDGCCSWFAASYALGISYSQAMAIPDGTVMTGRNGLGNGIVIGGNFFHWAW